jgi:hypothetical protein
MNNDESAPYLPGLEPEKKPLEQIVSNEPKTDNKTDIDRYDITDHCPQCDLYGGRCPRHSK